MVFKTRMMITSKHLIGLKTKLSKKYFRSKWGLNGVDKQSKHIAFEIKTEKFSGL
jgi:hypothetical protein